MLLPLASGPPLPGERAAAVGTCVPLRRTSATRSAATACRSCPSNAPSGACLSWVWKTLAKAASKAGDAWWGRVYEVG